MLNNDRLLVQILLLALLGACLWVMAPFWSALFWGAVLAFASWPLMRLLTRALNGRESLAAGILTLGWMLLVAGPLVWLGFNLADHVRDATAFVKDVQVDGLPDPPTWLGSIPFVGERLVGYWTTIDQQGAAMLASVKPYLGQVGNWLLARSAQIGGGILELTLSLVFVFFFYRDGPRLAAFVLSLLERLIGERAQYYVDLVAGTVQRVVNGVIGTAAAQALLALDRFPDCWRTRCAGAGHRHLSAESGAHGAAADLDSGHGLARLEGRVRHGDFSRLVGHVHRQRRRQRAQALPDQPRRQPAFSDRAVRRVRWFAGVRLHRSVHWSDLAGSGLQSVA